MGSCIHCHQIGDAERDLYRAQGEPIPETVLYPYPHPKSVGLILDPHTAASIKEVTDNSVASAAGLQSSDEIASIEGQPILSMADVQWVLHQTPPAGGELDLTINRDGSQLTKTLVLKTGWRRNGDISWRVSSWGLRRMATGGMFLKNLSDEERKRNKIEPAAMALFAEHVGQYGAHAAAKRAGALKGDIIVAVDGRTDLQTEADLFRYAVTEKKPGEKISVTVLRNGKRVKLEIPMQK